MSEETSTVGERPAMFARWLAIACAVVALDQVTKQIAEAALAYNESVALLPVFNFTLRYNTGAAFSFLANAGGWQQWLFSALAVIISAVCLVMLVRTPRADWRCGCRAASRR